MDMGDLPGDLPNMNEKVTELCLVGPYHFYPDEAKATWFIDDHGNKWVKFVAGGKKYCVPQERILWIKQ